MSQGNSKSLLLRGYVVLVFIFVFTPIVTSFIFSVNSDRFPTIPLGHFTTHWYETIFADPDVWDAFRVSGIVSITVAILATFIGFCTAYTDYRYNFTGKALYLSLALLPPTIPLVIMGLAMLALLARINMSGEIYSIVVSHVVLCSPFLGASNWRAMREVIVPFCRPAIASAFCLTAAVSFDEFAVAWFVSGLNKTVPVIILEILQGNTDPQINAIGSIVFITSMTLVILAQLILMRKTINQTATGI